MCARARAQEASQRHLNPTLSTLEDNADSKSLITMAPAMPRVILARHGETEWSISGQHTGRSDIPLTKHGEDVMRQLAPTFVSCDGSKMVDPRHISHILCSPRRRSQRTLELMMSHLTQDERDQIVPVETVQDCREWDYGAYEGLKTHEIRAKHPGWDIWTEGTPDNPEKPQELPGESAEEMTARVDRVIAKIRTLQKAVIEGKTAELHDEAVTKRGGDVMLVAHGHFNRCFIARWLNLPLTLGRLFEVDAGGVAILCYAHGSFDEPTIAGIFSSKTGPRSSATVVGAAQHGEFSAALYHGGNTVLICLQQSKRPTRSTSTSRSSPVPFPTERCGRTGQAQGRCRCLRPNPACRSRCATVRSPC